MPYIRLNTFKTVIAIIASLILLCSCHQDKKYKIGVSQCSYDDWRLKLNEEINREALLYDDMDIEIVSAYDDPERQQEDVRRFIRDGVDVIIASPQNTENLNSVLQEARNKGIKVMIFDRTASEKCYDVFVGADNQKLGKAAGDYLLYRLGRKGRFLEITGAPGSSPAAGRHEGFMTALTSAPEATLISSVPGDWSENRGAEVADSLLRIYPDIDGVYAHNDRMATGVRNAADRLGLKEIVIVGTDAVPQGGIKSVAEGKIDATFMYPTAGKELIALAHQAAVGQPLKDRLIISSALPVDSTNAEMLLQLANSIDDEKSKISYLKGIVDDLYSRETAQRNFLIAIIVVAILLGVIVFGVLRAYFQQQRIKATLSENNDQLTRQRDELESLNTRLKEATTAKLAFFTNVSHDLRTPLTLIAEPINQIKDAPNLTSEQDDLMRIANKNIKILMRLINQILDFRKYENGKLTLSLSEANIRENFIGWADAFRHLALKRHIKFNLTFGNLEVEHAALDTEKIERIFFNLMSNAFKFTPPNSEISAHVFSTSSNLHIEIKDSGKGMNEEEMKYAFDRFYQADKIEPKGSGIGLAVTKAFVDLHNGSITIESAPGKGTMFKIVIPVTHLEYNAEEADKKEIAHLSSEGVDEELAGIETSFDPAQGNDTDLPSLLIIDDTPDIRMLIRTLLGREYNILEAPNGEQGIRVATKYIPDLIICDVMMPGIGGMECVKRLKNEIATSHIPVLMLTACSLDEQRTDGFISGADAYLAKPFNLELLKAQCESLIKNRERIRKSLAESTENGILVAVSEQVKSPKESKSVVRQGERTEQGIENEFYQKFIDIIDQEIGNAEISIEEIGTRLGLSRVQFYRKIKAITNYSPNEILKNRRLKTAYNRLVSSESTVSEIAYSVGFSSPGYFAKCFREHFGELPLEVQKRTSKIVNPD